MNLIPSHSRFNLQATSRLLCLAILMPCLIATSLNAQTGVKATLITGEQIKLTKWAVKDGILSNGDNSIDLNQVSSLDFGQSISESTPSRLIYLAGGGTLNASEVVFTGEQFVVGCNFGRLTFPSDAIKGVVFQMSADLSRFERAMKNRSVEQDIIIADRGGSLGSVKGLIESIDTERMKVNVKDKSRSIAFNKLVAIVTADLQPSKSTGTQTMVSMVNGSVIKGGLTSIEDGKLNLSLAGNASLSVKTTQVASLAMQSNRVIYLSDLEPSDIEEDSLATVAFPWKKDKNVLGEALRLNFPSARTSKAYSRGIGTHSASRLEFNNENDFDRLAGIVGIDAGTEGRGDCVVSVWGDGIKLWEQKITGKSEPAPLELDISGMQQVALVVRNGKNLDLGDHVDWANIRFMNTKD